MLIKSTKRINWINNQNDGDNIIADIRREIDRLPTLPKKQNIIKRKLDLFETCLVLNVIFSIPLGSIFIMGGAMYSHFSIFVSGMIILLEGIFTYALFGSLPLFIKNIKLLKIRRIIARNKFNYY